MYCREILKKENNSTCDGFFWVNRRSDPTHYSRGSGGWKFDLSISDKTGEIRLTYFEKDEDLINKKFISITKNSFIKVVGSVNIWKERYSITVGKGGLLEPVKESEVDISQFVYESNQNKDDLIQDINDAINDMDDNPLKELMKLFMTDSTFLKEFATKPGAIKYHHACKGGLLEHTWEVLSHCKTTLAVHGTLNKNLVYAGAILHDIGKIREIRMNIGGFAPTEEGSLLGHIILGTEIVNNKISQISDFPIQLKNQLLHIILSHHEKVEWGSPVKTMTPEAITVACADAIGSKVSQYIRAVKDTGTDDNKFYVRPIGWVYKSD